MPQIFYYDEAGLLVSSKPKGRGRPPKDAAVDDKGNLHVPFSPAPFHPEYIRIQEDGTLIRQFKGRGCPRRQYVLQEDGEYAGHFVKDE